MKHYENLLSRGCFSRKQLIELWNLLETHQKNNELAGIDTVLPQRYNRNDL